MRKCFIIFLEVLLSSRVLAQPSFKTEVPLQAVVAGESFQVQYEIEDAEKVENFTPPFFKNFRLVTGPNTYNGSVMAPNRTRHLTNNSVYTLVATKPGRFIIEGATATIDGKPESSNDVVLEVISKEEAARRASKAIMQNNSAYLLQPGEDAYKKIENNLFLKVMVDKYSCFVGEPVVATFKLYSRLESKSDIVKNPGFYGFTVYDMVNLADQQTVTEIIHGKTFDVHTIRKVQLYPLRPGTFRIDPMEIRNTVEFSKSSVNKKTEQEVIEGLLTNNNNESPGPNTAVYETNTNTDPVPITVKPTPSKNKPAVFTGAAGNFSISAALEKDQLARNQEGTLVVTIRGRGNFTQLDAPLIQWPAGIEGFEPRVKDSLDKTSSPLGGSRVFRYGFVSAKPGIYPIPAIPFSYFDSKAGIYKVLYSPALQVSISAEEKNSIAPEKNIKNTVPAKNHFYYWLGAAALLLAIFIFFIVQRKKTNEKKSLMVQAGQINPAIDELLQPAALLLGAADKDFYAALRQALWNYAAQAFGLAGSGMNKEILSAKMAARKVDQQLVGELLELLRQCEVGLFTSANLAGDKKEQWQRAKNIMGAIDKYLF